MAVNLQLRVRSLERARLHVELGDARLGVRPLNGNIQRIELPGVMLPSGNSVLTLQPDTPPGRAGEGDPRLLAIALYELTVQAVP